MGPPCHLHCINSSDFLINNSLLRTYCEHSISITLVVTNVINYIFPRVGTSWQVDEGQEQARGVFWPQFQFHLEEQRIFGFYLQFCSFKTTDFSNCMRKITYFPRIMRIYERSSIEVDIFLSRYVYYQISWIID